MSDPFVGEVRMFGGNFASAGWALCNGNVLAISGNETLFTLIGTTYGGDGQTTFALPDLRGRVPIHQGNGQGLTPRTIGTLAGTETVTLTTAAMPSHGHGFNATTNAGTLDGPAANAVPARPTNGVTPFLYLVPGTSTLQTGPMTPTSVGPSGSNQPHDNMMPSLCVTFIIALQGIFPSRN